MASNTKLQELCADFIKDYNDAVNEYNAGSIVEFFKKIRIPIEFISKIFLAASLSESEFKDLDDNVCYIDSYGRVMPQRSGNVVSGSGWVKNAIHLISKGHTFLSYNGTNAKTNLEWNKRREKVVSCLHVLNTTYSDASTKLHSGNKQSLEIEAKNCANQFIILFDKLSEVATGEIKNVIDNVISFEDLSPKISSADIAISLSNDFVKLEEVTRNFSSSGGVKYIAITPEYIFPSDVRILDKSLLDSFFAVKWSLVIDFNPDVDSDLSLQSRCKNKSKIIVDKLAQHDGSNITNWFYAKGCSNTGTRTDSITLTRKLPGEFSSIMSQVSRMGHTDDYVIITFCDQTNITLVLKMFERLESIFGDWDKVENRCKLVFFTKDINVIEDINKWSEEYGLSPLIVEENLSGFLLYLSNTHLKQKSTEEQIRIKRGSLDITQLVNSYKSAGIEFVGPHYYIPSNDNLWNFYQGAEISWTELEMDADAKRGIFRQFYSSVKDYIGKNSRTLTLFHRPGSGATTLARRLGYELYQDDLSGVVDCTPIHIVKYNNHTMDYLNDLSLRLDGRSIFAIVESKNINKTNFTKLQNGVSRSKIKVTFLYVETYTGNFGNANQSNLWLLEDRLTPIDEEKFIAKYKENGLKEEVLEEAKSFQAALEVIDFPILLTEEKTNEASLIEYIKSWLNELPEGLRDFCGFVAFAFKYSGSSVNQILLKDLWRRTIDDTNYTSITGYPLSVLKALRKLIIEEPAVEGTSGIWRPRYNKFADIILKAWRGEWTAQLTTMSKEFIDLCNRQGELGQIDMNLLYDIFVLRKEEDFRSDIDGKHKNKFSRLLNDIADMERAESLLYDIVEAFPNDSVFRGHYARFLYEKATGSDVTSDDRLYKDSQEQLDIAFELNEHDSDLYHMQGMLLRRRLSSLRKEVEKQDEIDAERSLEILEDWVAQALVAFDESIKYDPSSPYGYAATCQLLKEAIDFGKVIFGSKDYQFCVSDDVFMEYATLLGEKLTQFEDITYAIKSSGITQIGPTLKIYESCRAFHRNIIGSTRTSITRYRDFYSKSTDRDQKCLWGDFLVNAILYSHSSNGEMRKEAYASLNIQEKKEVESILKIQRQEGELKSYEKLFRLYLYGKCSFSIDDAIDLWKECEDQYMSMGVSGSGLLNAYYYLAALYSAKAIKINEPNSELVKKANEYFKKATDLANLLERGTVHALHYLGLADDVQCLVEEKDGVDVVGEIVDIKNIKGVMRMKCGLEASFNARGFDQMTAIGSTIKGKIGFRHSGLGLYQFHDELEVVEHVEEYIDDLDEQSTTDEVNQVAESVGQLKIIDKIDLSKFERKQTKAQPSSSNLEGKYIKSTNTVRYKYFNYPVRSFVDEDVYDGADVIFEIGEEPNLKNPEKKFYVANNVRFRDR